MILTDESAALAESEHAMRVELQAQVRRLESVVAVLKQQAANHQRNELESLEHVRTACRQRDEARQERDELKTQLTQADRDIATAIERARVAEAHAALAKKERDEARTELAEYQAASTEDLKEIETRLWMAVLIASPGKGELANLAAKTLVIARAFVVKLAASQAEVARWSVLAGQREEALVDLRASVLDHVESMEKRGHQCRALSALNGHDNVAYSRQQAKASVFGEESRRLREIVGVPTE